MKAETETKTTSSLKRTKTVLYPKLFEPEISEYAYNYIKDNTEWVDSIYSKKQQKITRKGHSPDIQFAESEVDSFIRDLAIVAMNKLKFNDKYALLGIYVNYYVNGQHFCPSHNHPGQVQMVISLGATRKFFVGEKNFDISSGDVIVFGASNHGIPIEPDVKSGRISIAVFMEPL